VNHAGVLVNVSRAPISVTLAGIDSDDGAVCQRGLRGGGFAELRGGDGGGEDGDAGRDLGFYVVDLRLDLRFSLGGHCV
jgi:hypothetical protein